jgi:hypothetical protein
MQSNIKLSLFTRLIDLFYLLGIVTILFTGSRIIFLYVNYSDFEIFVAYDVFKAILFGIIYDFYLILIINSLFIVLYLLPVKFYNSAIYQSILKIFYVVVNALALLFGLFDTNYFRINKMRLVYDNFYKEIHGFFEHSQNISLQDFTDNHLFLILCWIVILVVLSFALWYIKKRYLEHKQVPKFYKYLSIAAIICYSGFLLLHFFSNKDYIQNLYLKSNRKLIPLLVNNPYLVLRTSNCDYLQQNDDWDYEEYNAIKQYSFLDSSQINAVRLILIESTGDADILSEINLGKNSTKALRFNILSSGPNSIFQNLDEILIGIPAILDRDFYQSVYSLNHFESLPEIMQKLGFKTSLYVYNFNNNTCDLVKNFYCFNQGIELTNQEINLGYKPFNYQTNNDKKFECFLLQNPYTSEKTGNQNFVKYISTIFDSTNIDNSINVLCVFDKFNENGIPEIKKDLLIITGKMEGFKKSDSFIYQSLDIMPTILNFLNYDKPFISYGSSIFSNENPSLILSSNRNNYYILKDNLLLNYSKEVSSSLKVLEQSKFSNSDYKDSLVVEKIQLENIFHSITDDFYQRLRENRLNPSK